MKSISELVKESMQIRLSDPNRSTVYKMLVGEAKKNAKEQNREATQDDLVASAKRQVKETENAIGLIKKGGGDTGKYEAELLVLREFLPTLLDQQASKAHVERIVALLPEDERNKKSMGKIMVQLRTIEGLDMKLAQEILTQLLA